jgi:hypothetical protein
MKFSTSKDGNSVIVQVPDLRPVTDPQAIKELAVRELAAKVRRAGGAVDMRVIEAMAHEELRLVDAYRREIRKAAVSRQPKQRRVDPIAEASRKLNVRVAKGAGVRVAPLITRTPAHEVSERWAHAVARIHRILENSGETKVADVDRALQGTAVPKLAREFLEVWWHYQIRHRISKHNPFAGLDEKDSARLFMRRVEDICDRSTGVLGSWWVR